jgi:hypothetical protein
MVENMNISHTAMKYSNENNEMLFPGRAKVHRSTSYKLMKQSGRDNINTIYNYRQHI